MEENLKSYIDKKTDEVIEQIRVMRDNFAESLENILAKVIKYPSDEILQQKKLYFSSKEEFIAFEDELKNNADVNKLVISFSFKMIKILKFTFEIVMISFLF